MLRAGLQAICFREYYGDHNVMAELEAPPSFGYFGFDELSHSSVNIDSFSFCKVSIAITGCEEVS